MNRSIKLEAMSWRAYHLGAYIINFGCASVLASVSPTEAEDLRIETSWYYILVYYEKVHEPFSMHTK